VTGGGPTLQPGWDAIERVLDRALELGPPEQDAFLRRTGSEDPALEAAVRRLLDAGRRAGGFLEVPAAVYAGPLLAWAVGGTPLEPGTMLGAYEIVRRIGRGATATVYLARDPKHRRSVAVKVLHPDLAAALGAERFLREIEFASTLQHPHILPLFDSGAVSGLLYYVMPHVEGESLRQALSSQGRLPLEAALRIAGEVAGALDYSHRRGVVHRDVKPENILLQDGQAVVADFGIARAIDAAASGWSEAEGTGTPAYMSPEQRRPGTLVDGRSDVYSLGCVLYELLAGEPPFGSRSGEEIAERQAAGPPPSLIARGVAVPVSLDRAVARALAKTPDARFATAGAFAEAIGVAARPGPTPWGRRALLVAVAVAVLAVVGVSAALLRPAGPRVVESAERIAVLPFEPVSADSGLARLGEDLAGTVGLTLDGVGGIATVDRLALLTRTARSRRPRSTESALELARAFGAGSVLQGKLSHQGDRVRLEATLVRSDRPVPLARATVVAPAESLSALSDSLAWALLRQVWLGRAAPTPSLSGVTTASIPALRAFLDGERALITNRWNDALDDYRRSFQADSNFALAYSRYAEASAWHHGDIEPEVRRRLAAERHRLPERDRLLADERVADTSTTTRLRLLGEITRRYPDYWPGWFFYGDAVVHFGLLQGHPWSEARAAFRRALAESPDLLPAWEHLGWISTGQDEGAFRESVDQRERLGYYRRPGGDRDLRGDRLLDTLGRVEGVVTPALQPVVDSVASDIVADTALGAVETELAFGFPAAQIAIDRAVLARRPAPALRSAALRSLALSWAARGAWDSALATMDRYVAAGGTDRAPVYAYSLAVLGAWLEAIPAAEAERRRAAAFEAMPRVPGDRRAVLRACVHWLDGMLAFRQGDRAALAAARDSLTQMDTPDARLNARGLAAFALALDGRRAEAGRRLAALEWEMADHLTVGDLARYDLLISRLSAAAWLAESGDRAQAIRLLRAADVKGGGKVADWYVSAGPAHLALARLLEAEGDRSGARDSYRQFLRRLDLPGLRQRAMVKEAETAVTRLSVASAQ
jgi:tRNA A-37 threonylcarbamoyl transferase component Bud32/TolB-like protein